jgi:hypothetical protein
LASPALIGAFDPELDGVVAALCARFPNRRRSEIECVVSEMYAQLAANSMITAHLIPLTLNRCRRVLHGVPMVSIAPDSVEPTLDAAGSN